MYNNKFILEDGTDVFPGYLDKEQRQVLRNEYTNRRGYMRCGCKPKEDLFYRISEDLKIYPEHNNYKHDMFCSRYQDEDGHKVRRTAYVVDEESGFVTAYIGFDFKEFDLNETTDKEYENEELEDSEDINEIVVEKDDTITKESKPTEPKLSLKGLVRSINVDTYTDRILKNKTITSKEIFQKMVFYRMKKVGPSKSKKAIGDLTLERDGVRFVYLPFAGVSYDEANGYKKCYIQTIGADGKIYNNFTYPVVLEHALEQYREQYGEEPSSSTMIAGFQYIKKGKQGSAYRVLGRIHLFETSDIGLYANTMLERDTFNDLQKIAECDPDVKYWIPPEDTSVGAIIGLKGYEKKLILVFRTAHTQRVAYDITQYVPLVVSDGMEITKQLLYESIENY